MNPVTMTGRGWWLCSGDLPLVLHAQNGRLVWEETAKMGTITSLKHRPHLHLGREHYWNVSVCVCLRVCMYAHTHKHTHIYSFHCSEIQKKSCVFSRSMELQRGKRPSAFTCSNCFFTGEESQPVPSSCATS